MRWLEGWFGTASGVLGALIVAAISLLTPAYETSGGCSNFDGGPSNCTYSQPQPVGPPLILYIVFFMLFVLVVLGTWIDLSGRRTAGRLILLISVTLLLPIWILAGPTLIHDPVPLALTWPLALV
ncbi:MAG: hypothetical protein ACRDID_24335, partial [Ktedonobacterales bacterium]